jgi:hypothetical protein
MWATVHRHSSTTIGCWRVKRVRNDKSACRLESRACFARSCRVYRKAPCDVYFRQPCISAYPFDLGGLARYLVVSRPSTTRSDSRKEQSCSASGAILIHRLLKRGYFLVGFAEFFRVRRASSDFQAARSSRVAVSIELLLNPCGWGGTFNCVVGCFIALTLPVLTLSMEAVCVSVNFFQPSRRPATMALLVALAKQRPKKRRRHTLSTSQKAS